MALRYSIDTSAILEGWAEYYPPEVFPSVWEGINSLAESGRLIAAEEVLVELERKDDDAYQWLKSHQNMVVPVDNTIQPVVTQILSAHPRLVNTQKNRSQADPFVIALARIENCTVVSKEQRTYNLDKPKIPDVCAALRIPHMRLVDMFRMERWRI